MAMRVTSPLVTFLQKIIPGQAQGDVQDGILTVPPTMLPVVPLRLPLVFGSSVFLDRDSSVTVMVNDNWAWGASTGSKVMVYLKPGYWEIDWLHNVNHTTATVDPAAFNQFGLVLYNEDSAVALSGTDVSRIFANGTSRSNSGKYTVSVLKGTRLALYMTHSTSATASGQVNFFALCNRLL